MEQQPKANGHSSAAAYAELRTLLVGPEREQLQALQKRLEDPASRAADVSEVLPSAVRLIAAQDSKLRSALHPHVEESIRVSAQKHPELLADALYPVIGAAIRKALSSEVRSFTQSVNYLVEQSLSWNSIKWRLEAWRTNKRFAEIVLVRSALYRVEQVFLIHKKTGVLLQQRVEEFMTLNHPGLVSGMLVAIQDFVRDAPGEQPLNALEKLRAEGFEVWIQHGQHAVLASVIRGTPPQQLRTVFKGALDEISRVKARELEHFKGDTLPFLSCQEELKACLLGRGTEGPQGISPVWWVAVALVILAFGAGLFLGIQENRRWNGYLDKVRNQPGIVLTGVDKQDGGYLISGLRDPMAIEPATLLPGTGIDPRKVQFRLEPYHSLQPSFEAMRRLINDKQSIESQTLHFGEDSAQLPLEQVGAVDVLAGRLKTLIATAGQVGKAVRIEIAGHTDATERGPGLALDRAEQARAALAEAGVPLTNLSTRQGALSEPQRLGRAEKAYNRSVSFKVFYDGN